jgi:hypothetical protein
VPPTVDDEQREAAVEADLLAQRPLALGLGEGADQVGQGDEMDAAPGLHGLDAEGDGKVRLAGAWRPGEMDHLAAVDEVEPGQGEDAVAVERGLEGEVEPGQGLHGGQPRHHQGGLDAAVLAQRQLLDQQGLDGLERAELAALELAEDGVEAFQGPRHAQPDQAALDAVDGGQRGVCAGGHQA